jgi:hypothetical protein
MAESELSVLSSQCRDRRIADNKTLIEEVGAWDASRNKHHTKAEWQFTTADTRVKLNGDTRQYERLGVIVRLPYGRSACQRRSWRTGVPAVPRRLYRGPFIAQRPDGIGC